ncbi:MAG: hypothetical protein NPIRA02_29670 [Nitrospirales bacterium]|nr:MAG: hypothetical protein NPIRA02_29670 [Nitrospirales bacterium]
MPSHSPEPTFLYQNTEWTWDRSDLSDYPSSDWDLTYTFTSILPQSKFSLSAQPNGFGYRISVPSATTANYTPSNRRQGHSGYYWQAVATHQTTSENRLVGNGVIDLKPDLSLQAAGYDPRSANERRRDELRVILSKLNNAQSYTIAGRTYQYREIGELREELSKVEAEISLEHQADTMGIDASQIRFRKILTRF